MKKSVIILVWCFGLIVCLHQAVAGQKELRIIFSAGLGDLYYPQLGKDPEKIAQFEKLLRKERSTYPEALLVDIGNFSRPGLTAETPYAVRPIRLFKSLHYNTVNLGPREVMLDEYYFQDWKKLLPENTLVSNLLYTKDSSPLVSSYKIESLSDLNMVIIGLINVKNVGFHQQKYKIAEDLTVYVKNVLAAIKEKPDLTLLLSTLNRRELLELLRVLPRGINVVLANEPAIGEQSIEKMDNTLICSLPSRAKQLAAPFYTLIVKLEEKDKRITQYQLVTHDYPKRYSLLPKLILGSKQKEPAPWPEQYLPEIGKEIKHLDYLKYAGLLYDELEAVRVNPNKALGQQIKNPVVVFYRLSKKAEPPRIVYHIEHRLGRFETHYNFLAVLDEQNKIKDIRFLVTPYILARPLKMELAIPSILNKTEQEISLDLSQFKGVEKTITTFLDDIKLLLKIHQQATK